MNNLSWKKLSAKNDLPLAQPSAQATPAPVPLPAPHMPASATVAAASVPSPGQRDQLFQEAEDDRKQAYELARRQQFHEFATVMTQWTQAEDSRDEVVQKLVGQVQVAFSRDQMGREAHFQEMVARHDRHFQAREEKRSAAFGQGSHMRGKAFQGSLDIHREMIESLVVAYRQAFERFRKDADCEELVASFTGRFKEIIRVERSSFKLAQDARGKGQANLKLGSHSREVPYPHVGLPKLMNLGPYQPHPLPRRPLPSLPDPPPPSLIYHSSHVVPSGRIPPQPQTPTLPARQETGAIHPLPHHPADNVAFPSPNVSQSSTAIGRPVPIFSPTVTTPPVMNGSGDPHGQPKTLDTVFQTLESIRRSTFFEDQRHRENTLRQVKEYIKCSGERREAQLDEVQDYVDQMILISQSQYNRIVRTQVQHCDEAERYRDQAYKDAEAQMDLLFDDMLILMENQVVILDDSKNQHEERCHKKIKNLLSRMESTVKWTRTSFEEQFQEFMASCDGPGRSVYLSGTPNPVRFGSMEDLSPASQDRPYTRRQSLHLYNSSLVSGARERERLAAEESARAPQNMGLGNPPVQTGLLGAALRGSLEPFSPQVLFRGGVSSMFSTDLPTAVSVNRMLQEQEPSRVQYQGPKLKGETAWGNNPPASSSSTTSTPNFRHSRLFQAHFLAFTKSQEDRATQFATHLHVMHQEIVALHLQSQFIFKEQRALFEQRVTSKWLEHLSTFHADQQRRGGDLDRAELARQELFMSRQRVRSEMFEAAQRKRRSRFEERHSALRKKLTEDEARRTTAFDEWQEKMENEMEIRVMYWKRMFALDERDRQDRWVQKSGPPKPAWSTPRLEK